MKKIYAAFLFLLVVGSLVWFFEQPSENHTKVVNLGSSKEAFTLTSDQIGELTAAADRGDVKAARRLFEYYYISANDNTHARYWLKRTGDLGDENAKSLYASLYEK